MEKEKEPIWDQTDQVYGEDFQHTLTGLLETQSWVSALVFPKINSNLQGLSEQILCQGSQLSKK